jgi:hypothetical protein
MDRLWDNGVSGALHQTVPAPARFDPSSVTQRRFQAQGRPLPYARATGASMDWLPPSAAWGQTAYNQERSVDPAGVTWRSKPLSGERDARSRRIAF